MKLNRLRVNQVRRFREPLELTFQPGLNLLVGPNESGKSTLVRAIRAAFFERYTTTSVDDLRPWDDSSAAPEIELDFEFDGQPWRLAKRFLVRKRCDLRVGPLQLTNEDAENRLAALLGYQYPGRGGSRPELWGVPGLLWVEQGSSQELADPVHYAAPHLQAALGTELDAMASSTGDEVLRQIALRRDELLTGRGAPRGDFKAAIDAADSLRAVCDELSRRVEQYREDVDRLGRLQHEHAQVEQGGLQQQLQQQLDHARERLAAAEALGHEHAQVIERAGAALRERLLIEQRLEQLDQHDRTVERRRADLNRELEIHEDLLARQAALTPRVAQARQALAEARALQERLRLHQQRLDVERQLAEALRTTQRLQTDLEQARELDQTLLAAHTELQRVRLEETVLRSLKEMHAQIRELEIRQKSAATRLRYSLSTGVGLDLGGTVLSGDGEQLLTTAQTLFLPGLGELTIEPGGEDLVVLARALEEARIKLQAEFRRHRVDDLSQAESRAALTLQRENEVLQIRQTLNRLAPMGLDTLAREAALVLDRVEQLQARRDDLPSAGEDHPAVGDVDAIAQAADAELGQLEDMARDLSEQIIRSGVGVQRTADDLAQAEAERDSVDRISERKQLQQRSGELTLALSELQRRQALLEQQIAAARPDLLRQDIDRLSRSLDSLRHQHAERRDSIVRLQAALESVGAEGLEEQLQQRQADFVQAERRRQEFDTRARALDLLHKKLTEKRDQLKRRLQEPLLQRVHHYLRVLFPGARVSVDDALLPLQIDRQGDVTDFTNLSFGAREQLGLISRLAYADLLQAAGHPTLIILDDALVHSDRERLGQMKRILFDAAQRHQILVFSCHPDDWLDIGVPAKSLSDFEHTYAGADLNHDTVAP